jgi:prepilin-type N-terminal cleavage/methylation domain-containing protein
LRLTIIIAAQNLRDERSRKENAVCTERVSGFSLIEVMIGVAVFAIVILAISQASMVGVAASNEVKEQTNILLGCQQIMNQLLTYSMEVLQAQNGSSFSVRLSAPEEVEGGISYGPLVEGGLIVVDGDLNGNGSIEPGLREGLDSNNDGILDVLRVALYYKKAENAATEIKKTENLVLPRDITLHK